MLLSGSTSGEGDLVDKQVEMEVQVELQGSVPDKSRQLANNPGSPDKQWKQMRARGRTRV